MLIRRGLYVVLLLWAQHALQSSDASAQQAESQPELACGYDAEPASVAAREDRVPLLLHPRALAADVSDRVRAHRTRLLARAASEAERCLTTEAYLRGILDRLVRASRLEHFAAAEPALTLVVQCTSRASLPVARASAGGVILVPRALPELAASEDAIAAVLAHELAHLTLRHAERFIEVQGEGAGDVLLSLKNAHEREADVTGLKLLVNAGYDPKAAIDHLRAVNELATQRTPRRAARSHGVRAVHDDVEERVARLESQIRGCGYRRALGGPLPVSAPVRAELSRLPQGAKKPAPSGRLSLAR